MSPLGCIGISFREADVAMREPAAWTSAQRGELAHRCVATPGVDEAFVLTTCNRTEIYYVADSPDVGTAAVESVLIGYTPAAAELFGKQGYRYAGFAAIHHLFRVAASLDAMVVGEPQIFGQVKSAYEEACAGGVVGPVVHRVVQQAFTAAKTVRHATGIALHPVSVASVAVELAEQIFGSLAECAVAVLGVGEMSLQVIRYLQSHDVQRITVVNRTTERAAKVAEEYRVTMTPWMAMATVVAAADIVVTATAAEAPIIDRAVLASMRRQRRRPMFLIDIAVPRNIHPDVAGLEEVYLYDLDDLQAIAGRNLAARREEVARAEALVMAAAQACQGEVTHGAVRPTIARLHQKCETIRREEVERTLAKFPEASEATRRALEACTGAIVAKILHDPILQVKHEEIGTGPAAVEWLRRFFRLDETAL